MAKKIISLDRLQEFTELKDHFEIVHPLTILVTSHEYSDKKNMKFMVFKKLSIIFRGLVSRERIFMPLKK